ncbi:serine/threonine-protein kinase/endoribonuclease IRE1-like protein [Leptotrombidium deliense]|uniref:non-specific serine/threonine protein kinase n=1 Tax=Leptotrombidium deliense TaxID=299467 RepID=A0A443SFQ1_9ACAR|nr:serine/threonine-protein kinase/endoribonuclease IRE1-like protein [Leptotrombidium deliense]
MTRTSIILLLMACVLHTCLTSEKSSATIAVIEPHLLIATLDGSFYAIGKRSGIIEWSIKEDALVKLPSVPEALKSKQKLPLFLPDPKDGSLYRYNAVTDSAPLGENDDSKERDVLEKFPFTLSELVSASPCRSNDGLLYVGKKIDSWLTLNKETGEKLEVMSSESPMCPRSEKVNKKGEHIPDDQLLLVAKSEFHVSVFDVHTKQKMWNLTVIDYSNTANRLVKQSSYELLHLTSSKTGRIVTLDITTDESEQKILWTHQLGSPIVSIYEYGDSTKYGQMTKIPFTTIGEDFAQKNNTQINRNLYPTVYIGESDSTSAYALTTLVDLEETPVISPKRRNLILPLLEGPKSENGTEDLKTQPFYEEYTHYPIFGFYDYPEYSKTDIFAQLTITQIPKNNLLAQNPLPGKQTVIVGSIRDDPNHDYQTSALFLMFFSVIVTLSIGFTFWIYDRRRIRQIDSNRNISIGKITVNTTELIGRGSAGTCVYKGLFEGKQEIAVKRVITDYFILADREIELLRNLQHPNLIRYFATESDGMFRYIAIELAEMTLADFIENKISLDLDPVTILFEATCGLSHLHSLHVIHRDIKPANILISMPLPPHNRRKVLISDFGVSKMLSHENTPTLNAVSTTKVINGTEGWIPPEVLLAKLNKEADFKSLKPVDIFPMGCLFYYVLSNGSHPFGEPLERQSNILKNEWSLNLLIDEEEFLKSNLIESMISSNPNERPTVESVLKHPLFWSKDKQLQFLQDISDRIEKEAVDADVVRCLERGGFDVVKGDWKRHICLELQGDLRKFRSYKGNSVRDLLRALRNKRHHYRELPAEVQLSLGSIPDEFLTYFTSRFPRLIVHCYVAFQAFKFEDLFKMYYDQDASWDFQYPPLPKSGIRWYDGNRSPRKQRNQKDDVEDIVLAPNGMVSAIS